MNDLLNQENLSRDFKGVWIPKEIWLNKELTILDKVILIEIDSLDNEKTHCIAGNNYLANFCNCTETKVSTSISKLKKLGYIEQVSFDGRSRILKSSLKKNERQTLKNLKADFKKNKPININNNIINNNSSSYNNKIEESSLYLEKQFCRFLAPIEYERINIWKETFSDDIINYAIDIAVLNNKRTFSYIEGILKNWKTSNYKTLQEIKENEVKEKEEIKEELFDYNWLEENN